MPYPQNPDAAGSVNGHYLFEAATIIHQVIRSHRSLTAEQVDAVTCMTCGALQLFLADVDSHLVGDLGISEEAQKHELRTILTNDFLEQQERTLKEIGIAHELVDYIHNLTSELGSGLDENFFAHDEVIGRARQFLMTTCGVGKMPFIGFYSKSPKAVDPTTYKARLQQTEWGLIGLGLLVMGASGDVSGQETSLPLATMSKLLGSAFLGKALF